MGRLMVLADRQNEKMTNLIYFLDRQVKEVGKCKQKDTHMKGQNVDILSYLIHHHGGGHFRQASFVIIDECYVRAWCVDLLIIRVLHDRIGVGSQSRLIPGSNELEKCFRVIDLKQLSKI